MVLYQPQNIALMDVNSMAVITCVSNEDLDAITKMSWYHRKWRSSEAPVHVMSCSTGDTHKYICKQEKYMASLEIHNVQTNDSGVYYCVHYYSFGLEKFGNGTNLIVGDRSTFRTSVHILGHLHPWNHLKSLHLACVVLAAHNTVHVYWNISGIYRKGRIISREEPDGTGTWTIMNLVSLHKDNWKHEEKITCEAWFNTSSFSVHWRVQDVDELSENVISKCQSFLIPVVTAGTLLVMTLLLHLSRTLKLTANKTPKKPVTEDLTASTLNKRHLIKPFTEALRHNQYQYRWLYPFGIAITSKDKRIQARNSAEIQEACKELGIVLEKYPAIEVYHPVPSLHPLSWPEPWNLVQSAKSTRNRRRKVKLRHQSISMADFMDLMCE
ncbi:uncharacterized protein [Dendrobates tinctorius]|uniref:uncharacterized protein n=1 Tax=Dendrobates tinctorius TaxID=92724 RepID=UPI003CC9591A